MFDDDAARAALRSLADDPAPPATTSVEQVLRRGRRRVLVQRASAVAGVVAVVAAIGAATVLLRPAPGRPGDDGVRVAVPSTTSSTARPTREWERVPVDTEKCGQGTGGDATGNAPATILPQKIVQPAFTGAVEAVVHTKAKLVLHSWSETAKVESPTGHLVVEIPMDNGNGQVQLEAGVFPGTPVRRADTALYWSPHCTSPLRHVMPDGTVLQLAEPDEFNPAQPSQRLEVYRPDGRGYVLTAAGWSQADVVSREGGNFIEGGRGKLPVTGEQLADIATALVRGIG